MQEEARLFPIAGDGAHAQTEYAGDLGLGHAGEVAHLGDLDEALIDGRQFPERLVHPQHLAVVRVGRWHIMGIVELDVNDVTAAALALAPPDDVDHHRTHDLRRIGHELPAVAHHDCARCLETQVGLVHEGGRVEQGHVAASAHARMGQAAQLRIEQRIQLAERFALALADSRQKRRDLTHDV